jgi:streptogramin lyase
LPSRRTTLALLLALAALAAAAATPANADLRVVSVFGTAGSAPGQLGQPQDVTTDSTGNVYVANQANARVDKYAPGGSYLQSFGSRGSAAGQLGLPVGVAVARGGQVWVSDFDGSRGRITVFNADGSLLRTFGAVGSGDGQFRSPGAIALDAAGNAYVGDTGNQRVQKFSPDGTFITKWGTQGSGDGQFNGPRGISVDPSGNVLVADRDNGRVQRFSPDGAFLGAFGTAATTNGKFSSVFDGTAAMGLRPVSVTVAPDGSVYAVGTQSPPFVAKLEQFTPAPVLAKSATAQVVTGTVQFKAPGAAAFSSLTKNPGSIPVGSIVDTSKGTVKMRTATGSGAKTQSGAFNGGTFQLLQSKGNKGLTDLVLQGGNLKGCSAKGARVAAKRGRQLFGNAHGHFRTRGRYSSATVRGTQWLTKDTCAGTLTRVMRGSVQVQDLVKKKNVVVKAGHSYLARPLKKK